MTDKEKKEIIDILESLRYGKVVINKQGGKIINIEKTESIKLSE